MTAWGNAENMKLTQETYQTITLLLGGLLLCLMGTSCVEDFEPEITENFENILVVEAILTDEMKSQEILISRTVPLEEEQIQMESNAQVRVIDDGGNTFVFSETAPGRYTSETPFATQPSAEYQLLIDTSDGVSYASNTAQLAPQSEIQNFSATRTTNNEGEEGVAITLDSFNPDNITSFYRYQYEETYEIIAPLWAFEEAVIISENPISIGTQLRTREERVCYNTELSNTIMTATTIGLNDTRISQFPLRFISRNNFIIRTRYSILVRQFSQSSAAQFFYDTLQEFSSSETLFSQIQPGFIQGNIFPQNNTDQNVLGLFEVSSVASERLFFNFEDLFPDENLPPFIRNCEVRRFQPNSFALLNAIRTNAFELIGVDSTGEFVMTNTICGDCNVLGTNIRPDFWVD